MDVTVIVPVLNEREAIRPLVEALFAQTTPPAEVVIGDGGSTDGTREILEEMASADPRLKVVDGPGGISENRNAAIAAASHDIIACTDAGCLPEPDWLEQLTVPFAEGAMWVAGMSRPSGHNTAETAMGLSLMPVPEEVNPAGFLPGGASQAFHKSAWVRVSGFPERMKAGEDTVFGYRLKAAGFQPVFRPQAMVRWLAPGNLPSMVKKAFRWGLADGRAGTAPLSYLQVLAAYWGPVVLAAVGLILGWWPLWVLGVAALAAVTARRTRFKYRWIDGASKWLLVPLGHVMKMWSQGLGWAFGFARRLGPRGILGLAKKIAAYAVVYAKRLIRPLVPDSMVARMRSAATDLAGRTNFDLLVADDRLAERWMMATPGTVRVRVVSPERIETQPRVEIEVCPDVVSPVDEDQLRRLLAGYDLIAQAATAPPRIDRTRVREPEFAVQAVAATPETFEMLGTRNPDAAFDTARQGALRIGVVPVDAPEGTRLGRNDRIGGNGVVVLFGSVPMHDIGGGSRGAQMVHELVAAGYHVVHLYYFEAAESVDLGLRYLHPRLEQRRFDDFDAGAFLERVDTADRLAILELPHPAFLVPVEKLRKASFKIAYDLMDDWSDPALGGWGYAAWAEEGVCVASDVLIGSAPSLVSRLEEMTRRPVIHVPNAVNARLFRPGDHPRPADLPEGDGPVFEYHGSLYGDWFDWDALERVGTRFPEARVVVIGDEKKHRPMPANVHFLGLKPQHHLPGYLAHTDVAIIPFEVSETTHAVSPLKVFEYMAMGVPVAAQPLKPLLGLDGVYTDNDLAEAVAVALRSPAPDPEAARREHGWSARMKPIFEAAGLEYRIDAEPWPITIAERKVVRYAPGERLIRD